jgi:alkylation response protein AidB-like acyl-CoA dehydrogenase
MRGTASHDVVFDGVEVSSDALLPADNPNAPGDGQAWYTIPSGAVYLGIGLAARDAAIDFARNRTPNGMSGSIAELQTIQHKIAEIELLLLQARTLLYATAEEWLEHPERRPELGWKLAAAKTTVTRHVLRATEIALSVTGSAGMAADSPMQRFFRDARTATGHPPMDDATLTLVGKTALGLPVAPPTAPRPSPAPEPVLR